MGENATLKKTLTFRINGWLVFALFCALYLGIGYFTTAYVLTEEIYLQSFGSQLPAERIQAMLDAQEQWTWFSYVLFPALLALKIAYTALCLAIGLLLADEYEISFKRLFNAALVAETVFIAASLIRTGWAVAFLDIETVTDFSTFAPLSMLVFFNTESLPQWALYPLKTVNVFEVIYCVALGYLLAWQRGERPDNMFLITLASYGTGLILWVALVAFLTLQLS